MPKFAVFSTQSLVFKPKIFEMKQSPCHICSAPNVEVSKIQTNSHDQNNQSQYKQLVK